MVDVLLHTSNSNQNMSWGLRITFPLHDTNWIQWSEGQGRVKKTLDANNHKMLSTCGYSSLMFNNIWYILYHTFILKPANTCHCIKVRDTIKQLSTLICAGKQIYRITVFFGMSHSSLETCQTKIGFLPISFMSTSTFAIIQYMNNITNSTTLWAFTSNTCENMSQFNQNIMSLFVTDVSVCLLEILLGFYVLTLCECLAIMWMPLFARLCFGRQR